MQRFENVLLIVDRHGQVSAFVNRTVAFARINQARLTVLDVLKIPPPEMPMEPVVALKLDGFIIPVTLKT